MDINFDKHNKTCRGSGNNDNKKNNERGIVYFLYFCSLEKIIIIRMNVVIVIPLYKTDLGQEEDKAIRQAIKILNKYPIVAVVPESMNTGTLSAKYPGLSFETFGDGNFKSIRTYNCLVLTEEFYSRFKEYDYMLIYQTDAFVFSDQLEKWTGKGYDYIGAPWIPMKDKYFHWYGKCLLLFNRLFLRNNGRYPHNTNLYHVGNGGFSLRRISKFIKITRKYRDRISANLSHGTKLYPEDLWLHYELKGKDKLSIPGWKDALAFSFEQNPEASFRLNGNRLPFGCHAWYHPDYAYFWKNII